MAGVLGFEPRMGDSESPALPLGDTPILYHADFIKKSTFCKHFSRVQFLGYASSFLKTVTIASSCMLSGKDFICSNSSDVSHPFDTSS